MHQKYAMPWNYCNISFELNIPFYNKNIFRKQDLRKTTTIFWCSRRKYTNVFCTRILRHISSESMVGTIQITTVARYSGAGH